MMTYVEKAQAKYESAHNALQLIVDELNQGQRKKIAKNKEVKELLDFYKVDYN